MATTAGRSARVIDRTSPFERTLEAIAHVERSRTKVGNVVVSMAPDHG
ncbi:hypothetical protein [Nocardiopsis sp. NRRL B-16309]|nr:hypothetical protein [Nocardiopsis sp. NRRL B-16309]